MTDRSVRTRGELRFTDQSQLRFQFAHKYTYLINDFNLWEEMKPWGFQLTLVTITMILKFHIALTLVRKSIITHSSHMEDFITEQTFYRK